MTVGMGAVAESMYADVESLAEITVKEILRTLPSYHDVSTDDLTESARSNCLAAVDVLRRQGLPTPDFTPPKLDHVRRRIAAGLAAEDLIRGYRINIDVLRQRFVALCVDQHVPLDDALEGVALLWQLGDNFMVAMAAAYREEAERSAVKQTFRRSDLIRDALRTGLHGPDLIQRATALGVDVSVPYAVVIARSSGGESDRIESMLQNAGTKGLANAVITQISGRQVGLVARAPHEAAQDSLIAIGSFVAVQNLPASSDLAQRIWRAIHQRTSGLFDLRATSWRIAVPERSALTEHLAAGILAPLEPETEAGQHLIETLRAFLVHDRNVRHAAESLYLHPNTVRYRLARFESLTGRDIRSTETITELAWALELEAQLRAASQDASPPGL